MAALPSPTQVSGIHNAIYEAYYHQVDPSNQGSIGALEAAGFLKKSGLSDVILSKIWDLSNPAGKSYLDKEGFFVALKLVSLAQSGRPINMVNITTETPPPMMGDIPPVLPVHNNIMAPPAINSTSGDWAVKPAEKAKYDQLFDSLQPLNGMIPGNKVKGLLMDSKLPLDTLGKIWDLADMDKDGMLDRHEFMVAMHLVYKALEKYTIPSTLPPELMPAPKNKIPPQPSVPGLPAGLVMGMDGTKPPPIPPLPVVAWVVSAEEKMKFDKLFHQTDVDKDGYVSGLEIKDVFLQSGVPQPVLARIWTLCDTKQSGKLNSEQFALAMWLISQKLQGVEPPTSLAADMIPPSLRPAPGQGPQPDSTTENNNAGYSNPELDMITKDIEELAREKHVLETDIAQKEADIKIKSGEIKSLQSELDTLAATLKQLENQKGEAQKRLTDLKNQKSTVEKELNDIKQELEEEQAQVDNLRRQADEQEQSLKQQEDELNSKKQELEGLKQEEASLEQQQKDSRSKLDDLTKNLQDTQLQISQAKAKISHLQELHRQMNDAVQLYDTAISAGDAATVPDTSLNIAPEFREPEYSPAPLVNGTDTEEVPGAVVNGADPFSNLNGPTGTGSFENEDLFKNDPFGSTKPKDADPFGGGDPFAAAFSPKPAAGLMGDPFSSMNAVGPAKEDPFDPFGDSAGTAVSKSPVDMSGKDPFGCDPFASLQPAGGGPSPRPESPSPALPPKKSKVPPPRPAPPRPMQGPGVRAAPAPAPPTPAPPTPSPDPFAGPDLFEDSGPAVAPAPAPSDPFSSSSGSAGFADFANFDSKCCHRSSLVYTNHYLPFPRPPISSMYPPFNWFSGPAGGIPAGPPPPVPKPPGQASVGATSTGTVSRTSRYSHLEFTEDPFKNYRYEDPFHIADPFEDSEEGVSASAVTSTTVDSPKKDLAPVSVNTTLKPSRDVRENGSVLRSILLGGQRSKRLVPLPPEDQQLAWAAAESLRLETERQQQLKREQQDLEYALKLSRAEKKGV